MDFDYSPQHKSMALSQEIKDKAAKLQDEGKWFELLMMILHISRELIAYLRERKKEKQINESNNQSEGPQSKERA